ncbi:MHS family alpha-ketoglutarate permease-like MFS transporter [Leucobacter komagatae]|uniref:MHS family alpha-ketoglutarate permease-like MFS transporter n=1 Tax=Leucobacter komagatae TaxID=55969 RepID=A0A542Y6F3_9MICO|nr:MFS transporter [Leucobacter komagatae]TQL43625.1 MHS family alpha-ketoglutarate permease-like MFS transporter [Leucobacter komagatae]
MTSQTLEDQKQQGRPVSAEHRRSMIASSVGQILEWYEWSAYAVFAPFIAGMMFNPENPVSALLATFAVFAVGFLMRPLGGLVFGIVADRRGRKFVLITTMLSMAVASVAIGVMPSYAQVGIWASVGLLLARMVQGFAHGGESATANSYVAEIAPRHKRGQWGSVVFVAIFGGTIIAYSLGGAITNVLHEGAVAAWGWRIPFLLGAVLALVALWLRRGMIESEVFVEEAVEEQLQDDGEPATRLTAAAIAGRPRGQLVSVLLLIGMVTGITAAHYTWSSYVSTYAIVERGMATQSAYWAIVLAQIIACIALPFWGRLSDRVGRKPVLYGFTIAMALAQFPLMSLISDQAWMLFVASTIALLIVGAAGALLSSYMSEIFPTATRTRNIGIAYGFSVAVFGGSAPYLNQLFNSMDVGWLSSVYVIVLCGVTFLALTRLPETRGIDLSKV